MREDRDAIVRSRPSKYTALMARQFAMMLRARYAMPNIVSVTKTDGLTFKVSEIVAGVAKHIESTSLEATSGATAHSALATKR